MDIYRAAEALMGMEGADWRRHANPWSVYTRFTCLPLIVLALWSRTWIGAWALPLLALALAWTWANPRAFGVPLDYGAWASRATLGERVFLARTTYGVPGHHVTAAHWLTALSALGLLPLFYGVIVLDPWATLCGLVAVIVPKVWFCDRMVWLHAELTHTIPGTRLPDPRMPSQIRQTERTPI